MPRTFIRLILFALLITACNQQSLPSTLATQIPTARVPPPGVTVELATTEPPATFTDTPAGLGQADTPTPTDTSTETPTETVTLPPSETVTPAPTNTPFPSVVPPTAPPKPPDFTGSKNLIYPDVQGCSQRLDIDGRLYGHAFVENPVANADGGIMRVGFLINGTPTTQDLPVQQILTLGPFLDGDIVSDQTDSWPCVAPPPQPSSNNTGLCVPDGTCNCSWIPVIQINLNGFVRNAVHRYVCFDSCGNPNPPFCSSSSTCASKDAKY
jgi:hypothetical protein